MSSSTSMDLCSDLEFPKILEFIDLHWQKGHILTRHFELMKWQHWDQTKQTWNFIRASAENGDLLGVLGFIDSRHFEKVIQDRSVLWLAIWKVKDGVRAPGLGMRLRSFLAKSRPGESIAAVGLNPETLPLYTSFSYITGILDHFYLINRSKAKFSIAQSPLRSSSPLEGSKVLDVLDTAKLSRFDLPLPQDIFPAKGLSYITHRYLHHPVYKYLLFGVKDAAKHYGVLVCRLIEHNSSRVLRIVDYIGADEGLSGLGAALHDFLLEKDVEYVDILCHGLDSSLLESSGFVKLEHSGSTIIPNYFEPFLAKNIPIYFAYKNLSSGNKPRFFKGDADQDRPNKILA